MMIRDNQKRPD